MTAKASHDIVITLVTQNPIFRRVCGIVNISVTNSYKLISMIHCIRLRDTVIGECWQYVLSSTLSTRYTYYRHSK